MALISQSIPNLVGGISQQPDVLRRPNQCLDQLNAYSDPVSGLKKRSGSKYLATFDEANTNQYFKINRDSTERYIVGVSSSGIEVFGLDGTKFTVNAPTGYSYLGGLQGSYRTVTIADFTFITNPAKVVSMSPLATSSNSNVGMVFIRAVDYNVTYSISIDGVTPVSFTTGGTAPISVSTVASQLAAALDTRPNITAVAKGGLIKFTVSNSTSYAMSAFSSLGENYITAIPGTIQNFGDLPSTGFADVKVRVTGDPSSNLDDYYVRFVSNVANADGSGTWIEAVGFDVQYQLDASTMPHVLVREANGTFTFKEFTWDDKVCGDDLSNANPSFVGKTINNLLFFRNRLGFLSDTNIILSESGKVSNFFRTTVTTIIDSDPIDLAVAGQTVDILSNSIEVIDGLLLFSKSNQFLFNVGDSDILSIETASITNISSYQSNSEVDPIRVGDSILFLTERDKKTGVREYFYQSSGSSTSSVNITNHVPFLLPRTIRHMAESSTESIVLFVDTNSTVLYCYQYLWSGDQKVMSSWGRWNFQESTIKHAEVFEDYLYVLLDRFGNTVLEQVPLSNAFILDPLPGEICLDQYTTIQEGTKVFNGTSTLVTLPFRFYDAEGSLTPVCIAITDNPNEDIQVGDTIPVLSYSESGMGCTIELPGDWSGVTDNAIAGTTFDFSYVFSSPSIKDERDNADIDNNLMVRTYTIQVVDTGDCSFKVTVNLEPNVIDTVFIASVEDWSLIDDMSSLPGAEEDYHIYSLDRWFPDNNLSKSFNKIDYPVRIPIISRASRFRLQALSNSPYPTRIAKASWEATVHRRNREV